MKEENEKWQNDGVVPEEKPEIQIVSFANMEIGDASAEYSDCDCDCDDGNIDDY